MEDRTIRPSMKLVWAAYAFVAIIFFAGVAAYYAYGQDQQPWLMAIPLVLFIFPVRAHIRRRLISMRIHDLHLTIESGIFSRMRRTIDMAKIQDVTVRQSVGQRMLGVGDLMFESAGESSGMGMKNVDAPRQIADAIIAGSKQAALMRAPMDLRPNPKP
jgi:uncharacterized membrane protein YdbT with pleckstrin-like domain